MRETVRAMGPLPCIWHRHAFAHGMVCVSGHTPSLAHDMCLHAHRSKFHSDCLRYDTNTSSFERIFATLPFPARANHNAALVTCKGKSQIWLFGGAQMRRSVGARVTGCVAECSIGFARCAHTLLRVRQTHIQHMLAHRCAACASVSCLTAMRCTVHRSAACAHMRLHLNQRACITGTSRRMLHGNPNWSAGSDDKNVHVDVWVLELDTLTWRQPRLSGSPQLLARCAAACEQDPTDPGAVLVFGGYGLSTPTATAFEHFNDVVRLDTARCAWYSVGCAGT